MVPVKTHTGEKHGLSRKKEGVGSCGGGKAAGQAGPSGIFILRAVGNFGVARAGLQALRAQKALSGCRVDKGSWGRRGSCGSGRTR